MSQERPDQPAARIARTYDAIAAEYADRMRHELSGKPIDRGLLAAVVEMALDGPIADIGCGPGHVTAHLAGLGADVVGIDLSRSMIEIAREDHPGLRFEVASMTDLPQPDESIAGAVLLYSIIHLTPADRLRAFEEVTRVLRPGGIALVSFHIRSEQFQAGEVDRMSRWFGHSVDIDGYYLEPEPVIDELIRCGLDVASITTRMPHATSEAPTERAYVIVQKPE